MRRAVGFVVLAIASTAFADDPTTAEKKRKEGEAHAKRGEYSEAIDAFKAADLAYPRARHACQIGLTYLRRSMWAQAEVFLERCRKRARPGDELPPWVADTERQLVEGIANAQVTAVTITVRPPTAAASIRVSGFAADESFDPRVIHLPAGTYKLTISAASYPTTEREIVVQGTRDALAIDVDLEAKPPTEPAPNETTPTPIEPDGPIKTRDGTPAVPPPSDPPPVDAPPRGRRSGVPFFIAGGGAAIAGGVLHLLAYSNIDDLETLERGTDKRAFDDKHSTYKIEKYGAFALYGVAVISAGIGLYFHTRSDEAPVQVSATPVTGGGMLTIGWSR